MHFIVVFLIVSFWCCSSALEVPSFIHVCHRNDPNIEECFIRSANEIKPYLVKGVPEYNIPSLEPLVLDHFFNNQGGSLKISTDNVKAWGCSDFITTAVEADVQNQKFIINATIPKLRILVDYNVDGKVLLLNLKGKGNMEANITDCVGTAIISGHLYDKNGEQHIQYTDINITASVGGGHVHLDNLFNGDKVILEMVNNGINRNFANLANEVMPYVLKALQVKILEIANAVVDSFTYDQLFPE